MTENLKNFLQKVSQSAELIERLKAAQDYDAVLALAQELGMPLTPADIEPPAGELDEGELENVTGGTSGGCFCAMAGGGGGKNGRDETYGCACVGYGQGGNGEKDDFTCICVLGGDGVLDLL